MMENWFGVFLGKKGTSGRFPRAVFPTVLDSTDISRVTSLPSLIRGVTVTMMPISLYSMVPSTTPAKPCRWWCSIGQDGLGTPIWILASLLFEAIMGEGDDFQPVSVAEALMAAARSTEVMA
jgi:hypothetical protein